MPRAEVLYSGYVQGVGFRFTARNVAARYAVTGYVKNLPSGGVAVIVEGQQSEIEGFLAELAREMSDYVENAQIDWRPETGEFRAFTVNY